MESMQFNHLIEIGEKKISESSPVFIIGEAGVNHNGDMETAFQLIDAACTAGVDAVKFQTFRTDDLILKNMEKAPYQKKTTIPDQSQYEMLKALELSKENNKVLKEYCQKRGIIFLSTPFEINSLAELVEMDIPAIKIAATDLTNIQFLKQAASVKKPIFLSAGMCCLEEIKIALNTICPVCKDVVLMQCTANYPVDDSEVNLNVIDTLKKEFDMIVGFSDHSKGVGASPFAVAKGACVIEKHFTLDRNAEGPDHMASVTLDELKQLIEDIRRVERYLGSGIKIPTYSEQFTKRSLQKYFVANSNIARGEKFTNENIVAKRTNGKGISALYYETILGHCAKRDYKKDEIIEE